MNPGDWFEVAALLREVAAAIGAESADGIDGVYKISLEAAKSYGRMTLRRRREKSGLSLRVIHISEHQTMHLTLTTEQS